VNSPIGPSGWHPDPYGRFEHRYHNGAQWTADVSAGGQRFVDPQGAPAGAPNLTQRMLPVTTRSRGMAVASFVIGIVSVATAWLPFLFVAGAFGAVLAFVFGILGMRKAATQEGHGRGFAITGIVLSVAAALLCIVGFMFTRFVLRELDAYQNPGPHQAEVLTCDASTSALSMTGSIHNLDTRTQDFVVVVDFESNGDRIGSDAFAVNEVAPDAVRTFTSKVVVFSTVPPEVTCRVKIYGPTPFGMPPADLNN
jgi:hypothetical protein